MKVKEITDSLEDHDFQDSALMRKAAQASDLWINCMLEMVARNPGIFGGSPEAASLVFIEKHLLAVADMEDKDL